MLKKIQAGLSLFLWVFGLYSCLYAAEKPIDPDRAYNQGVDFYHKLDYNKSADSFLQSLNTQNKHLEQWAAYNLGNAFFNQAQAAEQSDPGAANEMYQKALNFFKQSIEVDPTDKAAKYNYELAAKKIIEQEQKAKQDQQQSKQDKQNQENKSENQEQKDQQDKQENKEDKENKENKKPDASSEPDSEQKQAQQSAGQNEQRGQMTQEEAMMLLQNFQKAEDQKKTLDLYKAQQQTSSGGKDW